MRFSDLATQGPDGPPSPVRGPDDPPIRRGAVLALALALFLAAICQDYLTMRALFRADLVERADLLTRALSARLSDLMVRDRAGDIQSVLIEAMADERALRLVVKDSRGAVLAGLTRDRDGALLPFTGRPEQDRLDYARRSRLFVDNLYVGRAVLRLSPGSIIPNRDWFEAYGPHANEDGTTVSRLAVISSEQGPSWRLDLSYGLRSVNRELLPGLAILAGRTLLIELALIAAVFWPRGAGQGRRAGGEGVDPGLWGFMRRSLYPACPGGLDPGPAPFAAGARGPAARTGTRRRGAAKRPRTVRAGRGARRGAG